MRKIVRSTTVASVVAVVAITGATSAAASASGGSKNQAPSGADLAPPAPGTTVGKVVAPKTPGQVSPDQDPDYEGSLCSWYNSGWNSQTSSAGCLDIDVSSYYQLGYRYPQDGKAGHGQLIYHNNGSSANQGNTNASLSTQADGAGASMTLPAGAAGSGSGGLGALYNGLDSQYFVEGT